VLINHKLSNKLELRHEEILFQILARVGADSPVLLMECRSLGFSAAAVTAC